MRDVDETLALADRHIAEGERRLKRLNELLDAAQARGADIRVLMATIRAIEESMVIFRAHRDALAKRPARGSRGGQGNSLIGR